MSLDGVGYWLDLVSSAVLRMARDQLKFKLLFSRWEKPAGARQSLSRAHTRAHARTHTRTHARTHTLYQ